MKQTDIENALGQEIALVLPDLPIAWPNKDYTGARPHLQVNFVRGGTEDPTLEGVSPTHFGYVVVNVVIDLNKFTTEADTYAEQIRDVFPKGRKIAATGGTVQITQPSRLLDGFSEKTGWYVPVRIDYEAS